MAGVLASPEDLCRRCSPCSAPPWWTLSRVAIRCTHGFCIIGQGGGELESACGDPTCLDRANTLREAARAARLDLPAKADPLRWVREYDARQSGALQHLLMHVASPFDVVAFHEHTGAFRDAWREAGFDSVSVSNRPATSPPPEGSMHFIAECVEWRDAYPWRIPLATAHPDCHPAAIAAPNTARPRLCRHLRDGTMRAALIHACWVLGAADRVAMEQPPSFLAHALGAPEVKTTLAEFGVPLRKRWWWWLRGLQPVPPSGSLAGEQRSTHHECDHLPQELRSISRAVTPPLFAAAHVKGWAPTLRAALVSEPVSYTHLTLPTKRIV